MVDILYQTKNLRWLQKSKICRYFCSVLFCFGFFLYIISIKGMGYFRKRLEVDAGHSQ